MKQTNVNTYGFRTVIKNLKNNIRSYTMIIALLAIWCVLAILTNGTFFLPRNLSMLVRQTAGTAVMRLLGMLLVIVTGNIDLSAGSVLGLLGGIAACCQVWYEMSVFMTILVVVVLGVAIGAWQGWWVAYRKVPAFIVTLGGYLAFRGILLGVTKSVTVSPMSDAFKAIGQGYVPAVVGWGIAGAFCIITVISFISDRNAKIRYGFMVPHMAITILKCLAIIALIIVFMGTMSEYQGVPIPVLILLGFAVLIAFIAAKTRFGRSIYAIGCNQEAAELAGMNTKRIVFLVFIIEGVLCGIAGVILTARLNAGSANAGNMAEMDAIAACVIGGASLSGGLGTIPGAVIGALVMCSLDNGMSLMNTENFWQYIVKGLILIIAVYIDIVTKKKSS